MTDDTRAFDPARRWSFFFLATVLGCLLLAEMVSRFMVTRISRIENRIATEYREALAPALGAKPYALFLGNSLMEAAVDFPVVRSALAGQVEARRFILEQTAFYDWYFGMERLFAEGARPQRVYLMLSEDQIATAAYRGDYSALRMTRTADLPELVHNLDMNPTEAVSACVAHFSWFYGQRKELRSFVLQRMIPDLGVLTTRVLPPSVPPPPKGAFLANGAARIGQLREICRRNGAELYLIAPPFPGGIGDDNLPLAAADARVPCIIAFQASECSPEMFRDPIHMNGNGAKWFTRNLTEKLTGMERTASVKSKSIIPN